MRKAIVLLAVVAAVSLLGAAPCLGEEVVIFQEGFEGVWLNSWFVNRYVDSIEGYAWGRDNFRAHSGTWSGFCAVGSNSSASSYPSRLQNFTQRGFSLVGYSSARLVFWEYAAAYPGDTFNVLVCDQHGSWTFLLSVDGDLSTTEAWVQRSIDLSRYAGQSSLLLRFDFRSNTDLAVGSGVWIDDVALYATRPSSASATSSGTGSSTPSLEAFNALQARVAALEARPAVTTTTTTSGTSADLSQLWAAVNNLDQRVTSLERTIGGIPSQFNLSFDVDRLKSEVQRLWDAVNQLSR